MKYSNNKTTCSSSEFARRSLELLPIFADKIAIGEFDYISRGLLTLPQVRALRFLSEGKPRPMREVSRALRMKASSVTGLMDRLVKLGLVRRTNCPSDRRVVLCSITSKGRKILDDLFEQRRKSAIKFSNSISRAERAIFLNILQKVVNALSKEE